jgi:hypothetical protein
MVKNIKPTEMSYAAVNGRQRYLKGYSEWKRNPAWPFYRALLILG